MNIYEADVLKIIINEPTVTQRTLSFKTGYSIGIVNRSIKQLICDGYIDNKRIITEKTRNVIRDSRPKNAVILAAGFGMRMVPINNSSPKALLEVHGERLIDRLICQLHEVGISKISVVVGFMSERFEYLIDKYGVNLIVNNEYSTKNNLHSLNIVSNSVSNTYIIPCDIWCAENPFSKTELYSWYMVNDTTNNESEVRVNKKYELVKTKKSGTGNRMIGIAYIMESEAVIVRKQLCDLDDDDNADAFWEKTVYHKDKMILSPRIVSSSFATEINKYEDLREIDSKSNQLESKEINLISTVLQCKTEDIVDINILKKGMTNRSFLFKVNKKKYIMRIPGEGTDKLINREHEVEVYKAISGKGLCDDPIYINSNNGYKITPFLENVRVCNPKNENDLKKCMSKLRTFHNMQLKVNHTFDLFEQIEFYESLWDGTASAYRDYNDTKDKVFSLKDYISKRDKKWCLTHIDAVPDNFLFYKNNTLEELQLTDWEYAGMQDPHVDIAMFCIYSLYDQSECDRLIDLYFEHDCDIETKIKIYCYIAVCGLLWSNWCEYKRKLGVEFGEYAIKQYRYAKDYYKYVKELISQIKVE